MDITNMISYIKAHPDYPKVGMIASHYGVVRSFSRDGTPVTGMDIRFDEKKVEEIRQDIKSRSGIVEILIDTRNGYLAAGEAFVSVVVAGDIRNHVFPALFDAVNRLKLEAVTEEERSIE
ncbi:MAG: molybdenum cofactor biosynthesis protein MoaE [Thermodesulfobacteriota bacterium]